MSPTGTLPRTLPGTLPRTLLNNPSPKGVRHTEPNRTAQNRTAPNLKNLPYRALAAEGQVVNHFVIDAPRIPLPNSRRGHELHPSLTKNLS